MALQGLASVSREVASLTELDLSFSETARQLMMILKRLVPCDTINLGTIDLETEEGFHFALEGFLMPPERRGLLPKFKHQHPMLELARNRGMTPPLRFSDLLSRRQFEESPIYRECYHGYTHSMLTFGVAAPPGLNVSFVLSRAEEDFSEKECDNLAVLQPLISSILHQKILQDALNETRAQGQQVGIIYGSSQFIQLADSHSMGLLQTYYKPQSRHRLPDELWESLLFNEGKIATAKSFPDGGRLCARIMPRIQGWRLDLWVDAHALPDDKVSRFNLTARQCEVLEWLIRGKGNAEIAIILGISHRTVEKHLEVIYRQLGVENRLAAIRLLNEL